MFGQDFCFKIFQLNCTAYIRSSSVYASSSQPVRKRILVETSVFPTSQENWYKPVGQWTNYRQKKVSGWPSMMIFAVLLMMSFGTSSPAKLSTLKTVSMCHLLSLPYLAQSLRLKLSLAKTVRPITSSFLGTSCMKYPQKLFAKGYVWVSRETLEMTSLLRYSSELSLCRCPRRWLQMSCTLSGLAMLYNSSKVYKCYCQGNFEKPEHDNFHKIVIHTRAFSISSSAVNNSQHLWGEQHLQLAKHVRGLRSYLSLNC